MKKWLTSVFLIFALAGGVLAGMPLHLENSKMSKCCTKAKSKDKTPEVKAAQLCCAVNCTEPAPTAPGVSFNFSPSAVIISDSIFRQIALLLENEKPVSTAFLVPDPKILPRKSQPKYIQHQSILI